MTRRSVHTEFVTGGRLRLLTGTAVEGAQACARNICVNLLSNQGEDPLFEDRGTVLGWGSFSNSVQASVGEGSVFQFAALDTLFFTRAFDQAEAGDKPDEIQLKPSILAPDSVEALLSIVTVDGQNLSYPIST